MNSLRKEKREKGLRRNYLFGDVATLIGVQFPSPALLRQAILVLSACTPSPSYSKLFISMGPICFRTPLQKAFMHQAKYKPETKK